MRRFLYVLIVCFWFIRVSAEEYRLQFFDDRNGLSHWHTSLVVQDSTGMIWVSTWNGLNRFDGTRFVTFKTHAGDSLLTPSDKYRRIELNQDNNLICLIEDSLYLFNTRTCTFGTLSAEQKAIYNDRLYASHNPDQRIPKERYTQLGNLQLRNIRYDYTDKDHNHWLIDDHGLYIATPVVEHGQRVGQEETRWLYRLSNGEIWVAGRYTNLVTVYDSTLRAIRTEDFGAPVYCIHQTTDGHIWLGTKPGALIELYGNHKQVYQQVRNAYHILPDGEEGLWVATYGFGLWHSHEDSFVQLPGTENLYIRRLLTIEDGTLFAATTSGLLEIRDGVVTRHQREAGNALSLSSNAVMCLNEHAGYLYVGTEGGGLNRIRIADVNAGNWRFEYLNSKNGLASDIVYEMMPWNDSTLLIQGNSALSLLNTRTMQTVNYGSTFFNYTDDQRLIFGEVPPLEMGDGHILVAPHDGLLLVDKTDLQPDTKPVRIAISAIQRSNGPMEYGADTVERIVLAPNERSLSVWFSTLDFRHCGTILYSYRFYKKGAVNAPWSAATSTADLQLPDLHPGEYVLELCSTNAYRQWQQNIRTLTILVTPAFLESTFGRWLIRLSVFVLLLAIVIILLNMRALKKKRKEALEAYLDVQERLGASLKESNEQKLPLPEVMVAGYLNKNEQFLQTLTSFMEANMGKEDICVDDLMTATGMSRSSLNRKMHELFNLSPKDFLQEARIKHACSLLKRTDMSIKEIAYACGFSNPQYFATCFKNSIGLTPTEYRE